jgi:hypothetical protein
MNLPLLKLCCFVAIVTGSLMLAGCSGGHAIVDVTGPEITQLIINPEQLARFVGGQVVITATVTDESGVKQVAARIVRQNDGQLLADVTLQRVASNRYEVTVAAPANTRNDGQSEVYQVTINATDQQGLETQFVGGTFTVPAPTGAPPPPP